MLERQRDPDHNVARPPLIHRGERARLSAQPVCQAMRVAAMGVRAVIGIHPITAHLGHGHSR
jgi:hypothetical protein